MSRAVYSGIRDGDTVTVTLTVHKGTPQPTIVFDQTELHLVAVVGPVARMFAVGVRRPDGTGWSASRMPAEPTTEEQNDMWDAVLTALGARERMARARGLTDAQWLDGHRAWRERAS